MDPLTIGLLAGLVGLALGSFGVLAFGLSDRQRRRLQEVAEPTLPDGAAEVLSVVGRAYVVVDAIDGVVRASPKA